MLNLMSAPSRRERPSSTRVSRRSLLAGLAVGIPAVTMATAAVSATLSTDADGRLVNLWRRLLKLQGAVEANNEAHRQAVARLPAWARHPPGGEIGMPSDLPEWTDAMLEEHAIPETVGRRPSLQDIEALNRALRSAVVDRYMPHVEDMAKMPFGELMDTVGAAGQHPEVKAVGEAAARRLEAWTRRREEQHAEETRVGLVGLSDRADRLSTLQWAVLERIAKMPAQSMLGVLVKLRAWQVAEVIWGDCNPEEPDFDQRLVLSILDTLERCAGASLPTFPEVARA